MDGPLFQGHQASPAVDGNAVRVQTMTDMLRPLSFFSTLVFIGCSSGVEPEDSPRESPETEAEDTNGGGQEVSYASELVSLPGELRGAMVGVTWSHECPVHITELRLLRFPHWSFEGELREGELVVAVEDADVIDGAMKVAFETKFPLETARPASHFQGDDGASMAANNTSAFNCRKVTGGDSYSQHSYGNAIDINPVQNPYVRGSTVLPEAGEEHLLRDPSTPGLLVESSPIVQHFLDAGWGWGGQWSSLKDYQHLSKSGL